MSDISMLSARLDSNQHLLKVFIEAIQKIQLNENHAKIEQEAICRNIGNILSAIKSRFCNKMESKIEIEDYNIVSNLQRMVESKQSKSWKSYTRKLICLEEKISHNNIDLGIDEISILNDIAEALDCECDQLFNQMRG